MENTATELRSGKNVAAWFRGKGENENGGQPGVDLKPVVAVIGTKPSNGRKFPAKTAPFGESVNALMPLDRC